MFIVEENNSVLIYDYQGKIRYQTFNIVQFKKFNDGNFVIITKESIDFVSQVETENGLDIVTVSDTNFVSAVIHDQLVFVQRKNLIPIMDVYNSHFINVLRLYQSVGGKWVHFITKLKVPFKSVIPTHLNGKLLFGTRKGKPCVTHLEQGNYKRLKVAKNVGISLQEALQKFKVGVAK